MMNYLRIVVVAIALLLFPIKNYAQAPPLGAADSFVIFTAVGAFNNLGTSIITGDIGTNVGAFSGFPPGVVIGNVHVADAVSAQAAADLPLAYAFLSGQTCGQVLGTTLGNGQILAPNIYCLGGASTINNNLILDGQGDPNAMFIFQIDGALSTSTFASVTLINGANICNVYWQVNGEFILGDFSVFRGTLINNGAISLLEQSTLFGRALSLAGAVATHNIIATVTISCAVLEILCPPDVVIECSESTLPANTGTVTVTDDCFAVPVITFTDVITPGSCAQEYLITREWMVSDSCANLDSCIQLINVIDSTVPIITCPFVSITIECGEVPVFGTATATDACDPDVTITFVTDSVPGACVQEYSLTRTWTATDDCGNTATCSATIFVQDNTAPIIVCPTVVSPIECAAIPMFGIPTVVDACDPVAAYTFSDVTIQGSCPQEYSVTRTWIATDDCGNSSTCSVTISVEDNTAPLITCPTVVTPIECGTTPSFGSPTVSDLCDADVSLTFTDVTTPGSCAQALSVTRTWIATDDCGNTSTCSVTIEIEDSTAPIITCPTVVTPIDCGVIPAFGVPVVTDACDAQVTVTFADVTSSGSCPQEYSVTRTWIATDDCGNSSTCSVTIVVEDNTAPIITCTTVVTTIECGLTPVFALPTVVDACDTDVALTFTDVTVTGLCPQEYSVIRTWVATDDCGNSATCSVTVYVEDNTAPVITCPTVVSPIACGLTPMFTPPTVVDACDAVVALTFTDITTPGLCPQEFSVTRTWVATDDCGNTSSCSVTIFVEDNTAPVITCSTVVTTIECGLAPVFTPPTVVDACDAVVALTFTDVTTAGSCPQEYSVTRTWIATDDCGNSSTCSVTVNVVDNTAPVITCPTVPTTIECGLTPFFGIPTAVDACDPIVTFTFTDVTTPGSCLQEFSVTRTWIASDDCGNTSTCTITIFIEDTAPPEIVFTNPLLEGQGDTIYVQCYGQDPEWDVLEFDENSVEAVDLCGGPTTVTFEQVLLDQGDCDVDGYINLYLLTWTATDICGNDTSISLFMALVDTIAPILFGIPEDVTVNCDLIPDLPLLVYATDECLCACVVLVQETDLDEDECQDGQVILRIWTAKDDCGNMTIDTQRITLIDDEGPLMVVILPELFNLSNDTILEYNCNDGGIPAFFNLLDVGSVVGSGVCGGTSLISFATETDEPVNCEFFGYLEQRTYHWIAVDICGDSTELTIIARLIDTEAPVITGVPEMACIGDPILREIGAKDNCGEAHVRFWDVNIPNPCGDGTAIRRTYEAYDDCGNMSRDTVILIPNDLTPPEMEFVNPDMIGVLPGSVISVICTLSNTGNYTLFSADDIVAYSECGTTTVTFTERVISEGDCETDGYIAIVELKWTITDFCGNSSDYIVVANIIDETSPVLIDFSSSLTIGCLDSLPLLLAYDNCGEVVITYVDSIIAGECIYEYDVLRFITVTDECGNTTTRLQTIHVGNANGPVFSGIPEQVCDDLTIPRVTAYDECADEFVEVTMTQDTIDHICYEGLVIERTWSATDACGNTAEVTQIIILNDTTPPEIQLPTYSVIHQFLDYGENIVHLSQLQLIKRLNALDANSIVVFDDCDQFIFPFFHVDTTFSPDCDVDGYWEKRVYTWIVTDICGNSASLSFTVLIVDDIVPVLINFPNDTIIICEPLPPVAVIQMYDVSTPLNVVFTEVVTDGDTIGHYIVTRTWVVTDECGNTTTGVQTIIWIPDTYLECEIIIPAVECNSHGVVIIGGVIGGNGPYEYEWEIVGEKCFIQGGQGTPQIEIYVGWSEVKIILTVTDSFGCVSMCMVFLDCIESIAFPILFSPNQIDVQQDAAIQVTEGIPVEETSKAVVLGDFSYWPVPASGILNLSFESGEKEKVEFVFFNSLGQVMLKDDMEAEKGFNDRKFDVSNLASGSYLIQIKSQQEIHTKVIVILENE